MRIASSDIESFVPGPEVNCPTGGHSKLTDATIENELGHSCLIVRCDACEPLLNAADSWGGAVPPLTKDEQREVEAAEKYHDKMAQAALAAFAQKAIEAADAAPPAQTYKGKRSAA